ncbi:MAG: lyase family protein [Oscillospiraceae bacterium]
MSDRDFCVELLDAYAIEMMHLSRLNGELVLWSSWEFQFVQLSDSYTTGSSIMPQKKNSRQAELCAARPAASTATSSAMLTALKGLPLAYNKDMQEDKEAVFDAVDTVKMCLRVMAPMLATMTVRADKMLHAAQTGFLNATDLADYLVTKGLPFRSAYKISGELRGASASRTTPCSRKAAARDLPHLQRTSLTTACTDAIDLTLTASRGACPARRHRPCRSARRRRSHGSRSSSEA